MFPFPSPKNLLSIYVVDWKRKHVSVSINLWLIVKKDPAKLGRANLPAAGRFARGQKKQILQRASLTAFGTMFLVDLHNSGLTRSALSH